MNHYTNNDRSSVLRNERRTGSPGTVPEKESDSSQEEEKRLPGRFSRIDRSDSESEEDDRLDEFIDSDLDEDRHHATSEAEEHTSHSPETRPLSPIRKEPQSENEGDHNIGGETIDTESKAHSGEGKADDALSDLEVPDTDAITFEVDEDDDLETTLKDILDGKTASPEQIPAVADCKPDLFVDQNSHNSCKELKSDPEPLSQSLAESDAIVVRDEPKSPQMERKTIRLKQSNNEDPLERRKRKFGLTDPVSETRAASPPPPDKVSAAGGWRKKGGRKNASNCTIDPNEATSSTTSTKRIRSFVVRKT